MKLRYCAFAAWRNGPMHETLAEAIDYAVGLGRVTECQVNIDAYPAGTYINPFYGFPTGRLFTAWQGSSEDAAQIVERAGKS